MIVVGRVVQAHARDELVQDAREPVLDTNAMRLIGGMHGAKWYTRTSDQFAMDRPTCADWIREGKVRS